jgi:hypothetical protein
MDMLKILAISALSAMIIYLIYMNLFKDTAVKSAGAIADVLPVQLAPVEQVQIKSQAESAVVNVNNKLPEVLSTSAADHPGTSVFNPHATGILPQNQDIFDKQADFGSDVTNIRQFYKSNPEVFDKILGQNQVTNVADWERQSKELYQSAQQPHSGPIEAANFEDKFSPL